MIDVRGITAGVNYRHKKAGTTPGSSLPAAGSFPMSGQGSGAFLYSSGNLKDPNRQMVAAPQPIGAEGTDPAAWMAAYNELLNTMAGPAPSYTFDSSPYQQAIAQVQRQAGLGQETINQGGKDLMAQLGQLRSQWEGRNAQDRQMMEQMQGKAIGQAQAGLNPVLEDLRRQGVDIRGIEQQANQRIGTMSDQAALQNMLSQRTGENVGNTMDATGRSAATQGAGALNTLAMNLSNVVNSIGQQQAKAGAATQSQYLQDLASYNKSRMGIGSDLVEQLAGAGGGVAADPVAGIRDTWAKKGGPTGEAILADLDRVATQGMNPEDIFGELNKQTVIEDTDADGNTKNVKLTGWEILKRSGVDTETYKAALKSAIPTEPKKDEKAKLINQLFGMR